LCCKDTPASTACSCMLQHARRGATRMLQQLLKQLSSVRSADCQQLNVPHTLIPLTSFQSSWPKVASLP
jgi:hypothetical protein